MLSKGIKNIIFDLGGVLVNLNRQRCIDEFRILGLHHVEEFINPYQQSDIFMQYELGGISTAEFRDKIRKQSEKDITDDEIDNAWNSFLGKTPSWRLDTLIELKRHYNIYLLSNTNELHWKWCLKNVFDYNGYTEKDFFIHAFLSYELHKAKPGTGIFQTVLNETDILPGETFFIDDSPANCETAEVLGISTYTPTQGEDWRHLFKE